MKCPSVRQTGSEVYGQIYVRIYGKVYWRRLVSLEAAQWIQVQRTVLLALKWRLNKIYLNYALITLPPASHSALPYIIGRCLVDTISRYISGQCLVDTIEQNLVNPGFLPN